MARPRKTRQSGSDRLQWPTGAARLTVTRFRRRHRAEEAVRSTNQADAAAVAAAPLGRRDPPDPSPHPTSGPERPGPGPIWHGRRAKLERLLRPEPRPKAVFQRPLAARARSQGYRSAPHRRIKRSEIGSLTQRPAEPNGSSFEPSGLAGPTAAAAGRSGNPDGAATSRQWQQQLLTKRTASDCETVPK